MTTDLYIQKHIIIKEYLTSLENTVHIGITQTTAAQLADTVNKLTGVLQMHLASEDKFLYPELLKNPDEKIRTLTKTYMDEMGNISKVYATFHSAYNTPSKILADTTGFQKQCATVIGALRVRIKREETELYTYVK